jgi:hypothetical protein
MLFHMVVEFGLRHLAVVVAVVVLVAAAFLAGRQSAPGTSATDRREAEAQERQAEAQEREARATECAVRKAANPLYIC